MQVAQKYSTLFFDTNEKLAAYSRSGVLDYWVVDEKEEVVRIFRRPQNGEYLQQLFVHRGNKEVNATGESNSPVHCIDFVATLAFPEIEIEISRFFP